MSEVWWTKRVNLKQQKERREKLKERIRSIMWEALFEADKTVYTDSYTLVDSVEDYTEKILQEIEKE